MTETPERPADTTTEFATAGPAPVDSVVVEQKPNRVYQAAAWVAIVAGTLFIVAVVFFSGFILGRHSGGSGHFGGYHNGPGMMHERSGGQMGPGMRQGGPGMFGPGPGPGNFGPGGPGAPGQSQAPTPTPTR